MISIKKHKKPILTHCKMRCDKPLHKKLDKFELTKFLNQHTTNLLIGKPNLGKPVYCSLYLKVGRYSARFIIKSMCSNLNPHAVA